MPRRVAPSLFACARKRLTEIHSADAAAQGRTLADDPLRDFIPRLNPAHEAPDHLAPMLALLERVAKGEEVRAVVSAPPRHAKTDTLLASFAWLLRRDPKKMHAYATYEGNLARSKSRTARTLAHQAGVHFLNNRAGSLEEWHTSANGGLIATSVGGAFTGKGVTGLMVIDDPIKNRIEAESRAKRDNHWTWFQEVAFTRLEPGASCIVTMARWHPEDLAGRVIAELDFEHVNLPALALDDDPIGRLPGDPLWPSRRNLDYLLEKKEVLTEFSWAALYQGMPRPRGGLVFRDPTGYDALPTKGLRFAIGLDCAYSATTRADHSAAVLLALDPATRIFYVVSVVRCQAEVPEFAAKVKALRARAPNAPIIWYAGGPEKGVAQLLRSSGVPVKSIAPRGDKFSRAQGVAAAWNAGRVQVPAAGAPWVDAFLDELLAFTGNGDEQDDQVDALPPAYDRLEVGGVEAAAIASSLDMSGALAREVERPD